LTRQQVDHLVAQLVSDRLTKARNYLAFAQRLDATEELDQTHIVSRCYYAMYHAARALVLYVRRYDLDDHDRLPAAIGQTLGLAHGDTLGRWREARNQVDYSPYLPDDLQARSVLAVDDALSFLGACEDFLRARGAIS